MQSCSKFPLIEIEDPSQSGVDVEVPTVVILHHQILDVLVELFGTVDEVRTAPMLGPGISAPELCGQFDNALLVGRDEGPMSPCLGWLAIEARIVSEKLVHAPRGLQLLPVGKCSHLGDGIRDHVAVNELHVHIELND